MTVPASTRRSGPFACTGGETLLPYGFRIAAATELAVYRLRGGGEDLLQLNLDYTVDGVGVANGGNVALKVAAIAGDQYLVDGFRANVRTSDLQQQSSFDVVAVNKEFDAVEIQIQELRRDLASKFGRSGFTVSAGDVSAPAGATGYLMIDADGGLTLVEAPSGGGGGSDLELPLSIEQGGTGADDPAEARTNLGLGTLATKNIVAFVDIDVGLVRFDIVSRVVAAPPVAPSTGQMWIIPAGATGSWSGRTNQIARWTGSAWQYYAPSGGWSAYDAIADQMLDFSITSGWALRGGNSASSAIQLGISAITLLGKSKGFGGGLTRAFVNANNELFVVGDATNSQNGYAAGNTSVPVRVVFNVQPGTIKKVIQGPKSTYVLDDAGRVYTFGGNASGQLGHGDTTARQVATRIEYFVSNALAIADIVPAPDSGGTQDFVFFITTAGALYACGNNANGQLGLNDLSPRSTPTLVTAVTSVAKVVVSGNSGPHALAITTAGALWSTGYNAAGQLGQGDLAQRQIFTLVSGFTNAAYGAAASASGGASGCSYIVKTDGTLWVCGYNTWGNLGLGVGDTTNRNAFVQVTGITNVAAVVCTPDSGTTVGVTVAVITTGGNLYVWGFNGSGACGTGTTTTVTTPNMPVGGFQGSVTEIFAAGMGNNIQAVYARTSSGQIWAAGYSTNGNLGVNSTSATVTTFTQVVGLTGTLADWAVVGSGANFGLSVLYADGRVAVCGSNSAGQLGLDTGTALASYLRMVTALTPIGVKGQDGVSLRWRSGGWVTGTIYALQDGVANSGQTYVCKLAHTAGAASEPGVGASWATYWDLAAAKGADSTVAGPQGNPGPTGAAAPLSLDMTWATSTSGNPGTGACGVDNATYGSLSVWRVSETDRLGNAKSAILATFDDSTSSNKARVDIVDVLDATKWLSLWITGTLTDNGAWAGFPAAFIGAGTALTNGNRVSVIVTPVGNQGTPGAGSGDVSAAANFGADNRLLRSDGAGKGAQATGVTVDDSNNVTGINDLTVLGAVTLAADPTAALQPATKQYVDAQAETLNLWSRKGSIDCSTNPNYPAANNGHVYRVSVAGKVGGASGPTVEAGDWLVCEVDSSASGNHATVGANWSIVQVNLIGALLSADIGVTVQGYSAIVAALAGLSPAADRLAYFTGATAMAITTLSSFIRTLLDDADAATARATLGAEPQGALFGQNAQTGTTYTLVLADKGKQVSLSNASPITLTVPPNSSVAYGVLDRIELWQEGAGQVTVAAGAGVTIRSSGSKLKLAGQYSAAVLTKVATDTWQLAGDIAT